MQDTIDWKILAIIGFVIATATLFIAANSSLMWDETVYIAIGKYHFSGGNSGFFENLRPPGLPVFTGLVWLSGIDVVLGSRILAIIFSIGIIYLTYLLGKECFGEKTGLISAGLLAILPVFIVNSSRIMTDIPSGFFVMLAIFLYLKHKHFLAGIASSFAFLMRFPSGIVLVAIGTNIILTYRNDLRKLVKRGISVSAGFLLGILPFIVFNFYRFTEQFGFPQSLIRPIIEASWSQSNAAESIGATGIWAILMNIMYYPIILIKENPILILSLIGVWFFPKKRKNSKKRDTLLIHIVLSLTYLTIIINKQPRFIFLFVGPLAIFASAGLLHLLTDRKKTVTLFVLIIFGMLIFIPGHLAPLNDDPNQVKRVMVEIDDLMDEYSLDGPLISTIPNIAVIRDNKIYPNFFSAEAGALQFELDDSIKNIFFSPQSFWCAPSDNDCIKNKELVLKHLLNTYNTIYFRKSGSKEYYMISKDKSLPSVVKEKLEELPIAEFIPHPYGRPIVSFRIDDVGSIDRDSSSNLLWEEETFKEFNHILIEKGFNFSWGVIPMELSLLEHPAVGMLKKYFESLNGSVEIVQQGYDHSDNGKGSEFKGLSYDEQLMKISAGKNLIEETFEVTPAIFVPTYGSGDLNTVKAIKDLGYIAYSSSRWDTPDADVVRVDTDISLIDNWNPIILRDFDSIKTEFNNKFSYEDIIVISVPFFVLNYDYNDTIPSLLDYIKKSGSVLWTLSEAVHWNEFISKSNVSINGSSVHFDLMDQNYSDMITLGIYKEGELSISGTDKIVLKNLAGKKLSLVVNGVEYVLLADEIIPMAIFK